MSKETSICLYETAYKFLDDIVKRDESLHGIDLEAYFQVKNAKTLADVYERFIGSAQNYQMMPNVIKFYERKQEIKKILHDYDLKTISGMAEDSLYQLFREKFNVQTKDSKRNAWWKWTGAVIDSARFINEFQTLNEFTEFVNNKYDNNDSRKVLALGIAKRIKGMGFTLVCDALKELGFSKFSKPDVHIREVFSSIGLCNNDEFTVCEVIEQIAEDCKTVYPDITPYKVDKVFWLICSGKFYREKINIKSHKDELIKKLKSSLKFKYEKTGKLETTLTSEETFTEILFRFMQERNITAQELFSKAGCVRHIYGRRRRVEYKPTKNTAVRLALALELSLEDTEKLLRSAGYELSRGSVKDLVISYHIAHHEYSVHDVNKILEEFGLQTL